MDIRKKAIFIIIMTVFILILILHGSTKFVFLEEKDIIQNINLELNNLNKEIEILKFPNKDFVHWDDTHYFVKDKNSDYIEDNLNSRNIIFYFMEFLLIGCFIFILITFYLLEKLIFQPRIELQIILDTIPAFVSFKDKNLKYISGNRLFCNLFNISAEDLKGKTDFDLLPNELASEIQAEDSKVIESKSSIFNIVKEINIVSEKNIWISTSKSVYTDGKGNVKGIICIFQDITIQKELEEKLNHIAFFDSLTTLPNRNFFSKQVEEIIYNMDTDKVKFAILYIDLDRFKTINDTLGHNIGDIFLKHIAMKMKKTIGINNMIARLGGDEFAIVMFFNDKEEVFKMCENLIYVIKEPWQFNDYEFYITASIGIAFAPEHGSTFDILLKNADSAMYFAKNQGKDTYRTYTTTLSKEALKKISLETNLRAALLKEEFLIYYQPQINLKTGEIVGIEALLRWDHPKLGIVPPSKFIPFAESSGLIMPIGEWVLKSACIQAKLWQNLGLPNIKICINISPKQFEDHKLINSFRNILKETNLDPCFLEIEITETTLMKNPDFSLTILKSLKDIGINIALDDFGTGYSSLSYLKLLPIDKLKIDGSFIQGIPNDLNDISIVKTIIYLSKRLNLELLAERVESKEQVNWLKSNGCYEIQGYYFSKPLPPKKIENILKSKKSHI